MEEGEAATVVQLLGLNAFPPMLVIGIVPVALSASPLTLSGVLVPVFTICDL